MGRYAITLYSLKLIISTILVIYFSNKIVQSILFSVPTIIVF